MSQGHNPFPGLAPYTLTDARRFAGRERLVAATLESVRANRALTLSGPAHSGKSSVVLAGVGAAAVEEGWEVLVARGWRDEAGTGSIPSALLMAELYDALGLPKEARGALADVSGGLGRIVREAAAPVLLILDQLDDLLITHDAKGIALLAGQLDAASRAAGEGLRLIMVVGEDLLPRWEEALSPYEPLAQGRLELPPPTVQEAVEGVIRTASAGVPPQSWAPAAVRPIVERLILPGQLTTDTARVEVPYLQLISSALFERGIWDPADPTLTSRLLGAHLKATLEGLGPLEAQARALLEQRAVSARGDIQPMTLGIAREVVEGDEALAEILERLTQARILRRSLRREALYELGHSSFAQSIHEAAEAKRRALKRQQEEDAVRRRRVITLAASVALVAIATFSTGLYLRAQAALDEAVKAQAAQARATRRLEMAESEARALARATQKTNAELRQRQEELRRQQTQLAEQTATAQAQRARAEAQTRRAADALRTAAAAAHLPRDPTRAALFLREVEEAASVPGWEALAERVLDQPLAWLLLHPPGEEGDGARFDPPAATLARLSASGHTAFAAIADGRNTLWAVDPDVELRYLPPSAGLVTAAALLSDGERILIAASDARGRPTACVWHRSDVLRAAGGARPELCLEGHQGDIVAVAVDPTGRTLATASRDATASVWSARDGRRLCELTAHRGAVTDVSYQADGERLATASADGTAALWEVGGGSCERLDLLGGASGHTAPVSLVRLSPDTRWALTAASDGTARLWPLGRGAAPTVLAHPAPVTSAAFSADGRLAFTGASDGSVRLWSLPEGALLEACPLGEPISALTLLPASEGSPGLRWAAGTTAGSLWLSPADEDRCPPLSRMTRLTGHLGAVTTVEASDDGRVLLSASAEGEARVWRIGPEQGEEATPPPPPRWRGEGEVDEGLAEDPHIAQLRARLSRGTAACLGPEERVQWLRESWSQAQGRWQSCMANAGRQRW